MNCSEVRTLLGGYVLHALDPAEADAVRAHVAACPDCAREYEELAPLPVLLDAALDPDATPAQPPAALEEAVLDRFARERPG
ncbi:MAG: anti-sigma factor, partial [Actinomycetota bacterium]|nr:anti-sigma factor [Actinomycetota bacterium]